MKRKGRVALTAALVVVAGAVPAVAAPLVVQACPEDSWTCETFDRGAYGVETYCDCYSPGDPNRTPKWETVPLETGILPNLSIEDAQTITVSGLTVLAGVWGLTKIGRLIRRL